MLTNFPKIRYQDCIDYSPAGGGGGRGQGGGQGGGQGQGGGGGGRGQGGGQGQGGGRGQGGGQGFGPGGECTCMSCGESISHQQGVPCYKMKCPKCGGMMSRKQ